MSKTRMELLEDIDILLEQYQHAEPKVWRPSLVDIVSHTFIKDMHENDYNEGSLNPEYLWEKTPDEIMEHILDDNHYFESGIEFGADQLYEEIRDYLTKEGFIVSTENVNDGN